MTYSLSPFPIFRVAAFLIAAFAGVSPGDAAAAVWYDREGDPSTYAEVIERVRNADVVVLGEIHDNPRHHALQAEILAAMIEDGARPAVVWEMIDRDRQGAIDALYAAGRPEADAIAAAVDWADSGWPEWAIYRPIAEAALAPAAALPMIAGDLNGVDVRSAMQGGVAEILPDAVRLWPAEPGYDAVQEARQLDALFEGHCRLVARDALRPMLVAQYARDLALAVATLRAVEDSGAAVLITGNGHARRDLGVPDLLTGARPDLVVMSIGLVESPVSGIPTGRFDAVGVTERTERPDPCEALRKSFEPDTATQ